MGYEVKLPVFEGPLDLLLFLIRKNEIDIYDIPIAKITREYVDYIDMIRSFDLELAGEFLVMAGTLMRIKAAMLLPAPPSDGDEDDAEDPRKKLVQSLLEYQQFKEVAGELGDVEEEARKRFARLIFEKLDDSEEEVELAEGQVSIFDLISALKHVLETMSSPPVHAVKLDTVDIDERMLFIRTALAVSPRLSFLDLIRQAPDKLSIVVTFLALLELAKQRHVLLLQGQPFEDIWVNRIVVETEEFDAVNN
jgi:segregation and condensation protein A